MNLNAIEKELLNSPVRALLQRRYEARLMERLGGRLECMRVLEIGCGRGVGTEIIFERFGGWEVRAFDINCGTVACAKLR